MKFTQAITIPAFATYIKCIAMNFRNSSHEDYFYNVNRFQEKQIKQLAIVTKYIVIRRLNELAYAYILKNIFCYYKCRFFFRFYRRKYTKAYFNVDLAPEFSDFMKSRHTDAESEMEREREILIKDVWQHDDGNTVKCMLRHNKCKNDHVTNYHYHPHCK